jgi:hypothetical protein
MIFLVFIYNLRRQVRRFDEPPRPLCALIAFVVKTNLP